MAQLQEVDTILDETRSVTRSITSNIEESKYMKSTIQNIYDSQLGKSATRNVKSADGFAVHDIKL